MDDISFECLWMTLETMIDLALEDKSKPDIRELKEKYIWEALGNARHLENENIHPLVIKNALRKRLAFLREATTKAELYEIMHPKPPHFDGNCFWPSSKFSIDEEEMLGWMYASYAAPLVPQGQRRYEELFEKCFGKSVHEL